MYDEDGYVEPWYPEEPGQVRHAFCDRYELHELHEYVDRHAWSILCPGWDETDEAWALEQQNAAPCEHGLSASLCVGPSHYPMEENY